jgi:hypothetical protein
VVKATTKEVYLAKQVATTKLGSAKKLPKTPKGEREETFGPVNLESGEGGASTKKEASKEETSKDNIQVVEQLKSTSNSLKSNKEEKENMKEVKVEGIFQVARKAIQLELEMEWAKVKAQQVEETPSMLSMNAIAKALKVLQDLVVNERETNMQISLELKEIHKEKGAGSSGEVAKATLDLFMGKDTKTKRVKQ